eukprot:5807743-Pyramimonas_sp.AAC.1
MPRSIRHAEHSCERRWRDEVRRRTCDQSRHTHFIFSCESADPENSPGNPPDALINFPWESGYKH